MIQSAVPGFRFSARMRFDGVAVGSSFLLQASNTSDIARDSNSLFMMVMVAGFSFYECHYEYIFGLVYFQGTRGTRGTAERSVITLFHSFDLQSFNHSLIHSFTYSLIPIFNHPILHPFNLPPSPTPICMSASPWWTIGF